MAWPLAQPPGSGEPKEAVGQPQVLARRFRRRATVQQPTVMAAANSHGRCTCGRGGVGTADRLPCMAQKGVAIMRGRQASGAARHQAAAVLITRRSHHPGPLRDRRLDMEVPVTGKKLSCGKRVQYSRKAYVSCSGWSADMLLTSMPGCVNSMDGDVLG